MMDYIFYFIVVFMFFGVIVLSVVVVPYHGVVALTSVSFICCAIMVILGLTFTALVMYVVYLGGLVVVFSYCVSVEKESVVGVKGYKFYKLIFWLSLMVFLLMVCLYNEIDLLVLSEWEDYLCLEICGYGVLYFNGGVGLLVCSWGLIVALFSVLVIIGWSRLGGFRSF